MMISLILNYIIEFLQLPHVSLPKLESTYCCVLCVACDVFIMLAKPSHNLILPKSSHNLLIAKDVHNLLQAKPSHNLMLP